MLHYLLHTSLTERNIHYQSLLGFQILRRTKTRAGLLSGEWSILLQTWVSLDLFLVCTFDYLCLAVLTEGSRNHIFVLTASLPQRISPPLWLSLLYALASFAGFFHFSWDSSV